MAEGWRDGGRAEVRIGEGIWQKDGGRAEVRIGEEIWQKDGGMGEEQK